MLRRALSTSALLATFATATLAACGDDAPTSEPGPYDDLPVAETISGTGVSAPVDIVRDTYGVPHVRARTVEDLAFAQGYVMASDRIQQMDLFRHFAAGRVAELFGALDAGQIDADLDMRLHQFEARATESYQTLAASSAPADQELVTFLTRFADGVNRYVADLRAGTRTLDPAVQVFFDAERFREWTPVDSLVIGRLQAYELSFSSLELDETDLLERALAGFDESADPDRARRAGAFHDLVRLAPIDPTSSRDGFPGVSGAPAPRAAAPPVPAARPRVSSALLDQVRRARPSALQARLGDPRNGSNNWVVGPALAGDGVTLMANDPHLTLASPSIFWACHLTVQAAGAAAPELDVAGITFPGIPGVILGHNQHVAWGATTVNHDVTDYYLETIEPCAQGGGDCVVFDGGQVPIETFTETIRVGALGTITDEYEVTYERVPHHGPILPVIADGELQPRPAGPAISVRYTGHQPTFELAAFQGLWRARTVDEAMAAFAPFGFGGQNWVIADDAGHIGWTTRANVPARTAGCFTFDAANPGAGGVAPWWIVPGDGSCEWDGWIADAYLPQDKDPARGYIATANADPVGATADGDPFDDGTADGHVLYTGARDYDEGYRVGRISRRLEALAAEGDLDADAMAAVQADAHSNLGADLTPRILAALDDLDEELATPGTHPGLAAFAAGLSAPRRALLAEARSLLEGWTFDTPAAIGAADGSAEAMDSAATVLFNTWLVRFTAYALADEAAVVGRGPGSWLANAVVTVLLRPEQLVTGVAKETGEALLCDELATAGTIESCTYEALRALDAAITWGLAEAGDELAAWRWGALHRLTLEPLLPSSDLVVPPDDDPDASLRGGYPRHGDNHSVDASSPGLGDTDFTYGHGPAMRHITVLGQGEPRTLLALPGGQVMDTQSPHWRDLMDEYWSSNAYFELPWTTAQVRDAHEARWVVE